MLFNKSLQYLTMNPEAKASIRRNVGFLVNTMIIVIAVVLADVSFVSWKISEAVILLMCFFMVVEIFKQAYMDRLVKNAGKIRKIMIIGTVLLLVFLAIAVFMIFF